jgi:glycosyltransferase involved in cell wall biosynthesis
MFYECGLSLAGGEIDKVHFAYPDLDKGMPKNLPAELKNVIQFNFKDINSDNYYRFTEYLAKHQIRLVVIFDIQPVYPLHSFLRRAGVDVILTYWGAPISSVMPFWKLILKKIQVFISRSKVDALIFESKAMAHLATHGRGVPSHMIDIVPLGIDLDKFKPLDSDYVYKTFGFPRDRKVVFYSGHMERRKGVHVLIEAAIKLLVERKRTDVCFLLTGNKGDESHQYEKMYSGLGIDHLIRFAGYRSDIPEIYQSSFCGVIPSSGWDSFPRTSLEMPASGLPIVASRLQGLVEAVVDGKTGFLFEPGDSTMLADLLEKLLENPQLAKELGQQGRSRCETEFNLEIQRQRFLKIVKNRLLQKGIKAWEISPTYKNKSNID